MTMLQQDSATKDSLKASFEDKPVCVTGQCPLQQQEIAIFPVRYAIDEASENSDEPGPNPIPAEWQGHQSLPQLHKRTYTLRQLRDGWLYVINRTTNILDEYQVNGASFSKISGGDGEGGMPSCGAGTNYLLYPRDSELLLAYSSVQWTPYTRERMADPELQSIWMRPLDLASYIRTLAAPHCASLTQLADNVADIDKGQAKAGQRFDSTTTPSEAQDSETPFKAVLGSDTILGSVPDQDSALFIALDDNLGMLDDLSMQAAGPSLELAQFESEHIHRLTIAENVELLAGVDFTELESQVGLSPEEFQQFKQKAQDYLTAKQQYAADSRKPGEFSSVASSVASIKLENELTAEYGGACIKLLNKMVEQWTARSELRHQVRFEEAQQYSVEKRQELLALQTELTPSLEDLIVWLKHLGPDPVCIFHDQTDEDQCLSLLTNADAWLSFLSQDEKTQKWFIGDYAAPQTLLGLAIYNFDSELSSAIEQIANEFVEEDGIDLVSGSSVVKRGEEIYSALSNEVIRNSRVFQNLSRPAQQAFDTLINVASNNFEKLWQGFEYKLLPAISSRLGPKWQTIGYIAISSMVQTQVDVLVPVIERDQNFPAKRARWKRSELQLNRQITAQERVARTSSAAHERNAATRHVRILNSQLAELTREMPNEFKITLTEARRTTTELQQRIEAIQTLGRAELAVQMELKARDYMAYVRRVNSWVADNLNGGFGGLITVLNIWNVHAAMTAATADGEWGREDALNVGNMVATMLSGLTALTLMPMWARMAQLAGEATVKRSTVQGRLVDVAAKYWHKGHANHLAMFRVFAARAIAMSGFAVIASVTEGMQVWDEIGRARATDEKIASSAKFFAVLGFGAVGVYQLFAGIFGYFGGAAAGAVFAPWTIIAAAVFGVILLVSSIVLDKIKREGFKLWLHRSRWSKSEPNYWPDTEEGHKDEMRALHEVLMRPTILSQTLKRDSSDRYNPNREGVWLKLVLPPDVAGHNIDILPIMVTEGTWFTEDRQTSYRAGMYSSYFAEGNWVTLDQLAEWDSLHVRRYRHQSPAQYDAKDWRVWLVHVPRTKGMDRMEVEIHYPPSMLQRPDGKGYRFSIDLNGMRSGTLHENPYVHGEATEPNDKVERLVIDSIPARSRSVFNLGVI